MSMAYNKNKMFNLMSTSFTVKFTILLMAKNLQFNYRLQQAHRVYLKSRTETIVVSEAKTGTNFVYFSSLETKIQRMKTITTKPLPR